MVVVVKICKKVFVYEFLVYVGSLLKVEKLCIFVKCVVRVIIYCFELNVIYLKFLLLK